MFWKLWLVIYLLGMILLYFLAKRKDQNSFEELDQKVYPLKKLLFIGSYLMNSVAYQYNTVYDQKLTLSFSHIYGGKEGKKYTKIHWANQVTLVLLVILLISFFAVAIGDVGTDFIFISIIILFGVVFGLNKEVHQQYKIRQLHIKLDFTEFLSKLILLMNAGLTISKAWEKILSENTSNRPLYKELRITLLEIKNGKSEEEAYEDFANRCRNPEIFKFVSLIIQNIKKGNEETIAMLRMLTNECWIMRKNIAKAMGEEASTKLLVPMMIMFVAILLIVMTPAVLILMNM